jgi:hypothetical protein
MPMVPFMQRFPELGARETRSVQMVGIPELPDGDYGFIELYCDEPNCDCRRAFIKVLRHDTGQKIWATIGYGWESLDFYRKWARGSCDARELTGASLAAWNPQTKYSPALLLVFQTLLRSPAYLERIKNHYRMFRGTVDQGQAAPSTRLAATRRARSRNLKSRRPPWL